MKNLTLKPGLLVALHTSIRGGIQYQRTDLDATAVEAADANEAAQVTKWETTRVIADAAEYDRAVKVRGKASSLIRGVCSTSLFGLICPTSKEKALDEALAEAGALIETFNASAQSSRVEIYLLKGRIAENDEIAAQAIGSEVRDLIDAMKDGLAKADVGAIRKAANEARQLGQLLDAGTAEKVSDAIEEARSAARAIVKRVEVGGEDAALVIQELSRKALDEARFQFLDLDGPKVVASSTAPASELDLEEQPTKHGEAFVTQAVAEVL